jgi:hypothetical protein
MTGDDVFVFPSIRSRDRPISDNTQAAAINPFGARSTPQSAFQGEHIAAPPTP